MVSLAAYPKWYFVKAISSPWRNMIVMHNSDVVKRHRRKYLYVKSYSLLPCFLLLAAIVFVAGYFIMYRVQGSFLIDSS